MTWPATSTPLQPRPLIPRTLADLLVKAAPELADIDRLAMHLAPLSASERLAAESWARAKVSACGDDERAPAVPRCITQLYRRFPPTVQVVPNPHESGDCKFYARAHHPYECLGLVDASGPTEACTRAKALKRYQLRRLGVEWPGIATPDEAQNPLKGQVAINGHRHALWRKLGLSQGGAGSLAGRVIHWIMLNPSTAGAEADDATMRRVCDLSERWGYEWVTVGNLWSYRATKPQDLRTWIKSGGEWVGRTTAKCDRWVEKMARRAHLVVVAWGANGSIDRRGLAMERLLAGLGIEPHALAVTAKGAPVHPLYQPASLTTRPLAELRQEGAES